MSELTLTSANFDQSVNAGGKPVLVDFWAPWCGPCKVMGPIIEQLAGEMTDVTMAKLNVDEHPQMAQRYNVLSIPTFIVFKGGQPVDQFSGTMTKDAFKARLQKHL
ncbi:thioredoxin [Candidatus Uhrbacteria bacterium RIFCSPHIGHO2_01_FULL_63_20]|uniref:Thioredoxin n=1 Tax=Candidatus Uhrbacteria bacterium RIFCSPHIGHO2_01_FULL_63_20 TaxID=1802385 RepID=A0A1F7TMM4_9BACT|nr:MAG: thioredoxin [Candidatus Uhrbacteria bacterium RIFCSPHIGHO2_01_FULL_63_20]